MDNIEQQLEFFKRRKTVKRIIFVDDTFNAAPKRFNRVVELLDRYEFSWYAFIRAQYIDENVASAMRSSGCDGVYLGLESGDDSILKKMNKKATIQKYQDGIAALKKHQIQTFASFIVGFPGETKTTVDNTIRFIEESGLDYYSLKEFFFLTTSPLEQKKDEYELEGQANKWSHYTMNSRAASAMKLYMCGSIKNALHVDPDMGLWYLIYLRQHNYTWSQIRNFQAIIDRMHRDDNQENYEGKSEYIQKISTIMQ